MNNKTWLNNYLIPPEDISSGIIIRIGLPNTPFRIDPKGERHCHLWSEKNKRWWLIHPDIADCDFGDDIKIRPATLYRCIRPDGELFLLPVTHPVPGDPTSWFEGWQRIVEVAKKRWVTIHKNPDEYRHDFEEVSGIPKPVWPDLSIEECMKMALHNSRIDTADHPSLCKNKRKSRRFDDLEDD